ncbi:MAG: hypothetical protein HYY77_10390 [Betaproteobacteria bacterium]|nr:hypothetical protein [Betaproteobacteria bacterium]
MKMIHGKFAAILNIRALGVMLMLAGFPALCAAQQKLTLGIPGIPPVFGGTIAQVADKEGVFKKRGKRVFSRSAGSM